VTVFLGVVFLSACGHKQSKVTVPPPPSIEAPARTDNAAPTGKEPGEDRAVLTVPPDAKPIYTETGIASWYGPPYHNRRGSNGEVYDMNALTAAHRTLPLGSVVRVTNMKTEHSILVRITDRGPFIEGRIIDLSLAAAKAIDVWQPGLATVKLEVLRTPASLQAGGRWAVQIGAFDGKEQASQVADRLERRYHTAKVQRFPSPTGDWWVRVRVLGDDKRRAEEVARSTQTPEGAVFLVRLD
jgi:peptidoglycan lytic transglycosylase